MFQEIRPNIYNVNPVNIFCAIVEEAEEINPLILDFVYNKWERKNDLGLSNEELLDIGKHKKIEGLPSDAGLIWGDSLTGDHAKVTPTEEILEEKNDAIVKLRYKYIYPALLELIKSSEKLFIQSYSQLTFALSSSWVQFYKNGSYINTHNHRPVSRDTNYVRNPATGEAEQQTELMFSGGYYLDDGAPDEEDSFSGVFSLHAHNKMLNIRPQSGLLNLWPSDCYHQSHPFFGESRRTIIAFNISVIGRKSNGNIPFQVHKSARFSGDPDYKGKIN